MDVYFTLLLVGCCDLVILLLLLYVPDSQINRRLMKEQMAEDFVRLTHPRGERRTFGEKVGAGLLC